MGEALKGYSWQKNACLETEMLNAKPLIEVWRGEFLESQNIASASARNLWRGRGSRVDHAAFGIGLRLASGGRNPLAACAGMVAAARQIRRRFSLWNPMA
jgi:hypothetical protein